MPVIRPAKAWPYASLQHSGRMRMQKTNQITTEDSPGIQQSSITLHTELASIVLFFFHFRKLQAEALRKRKKEICAYIVLVRHEPCMADQCQHVYCCVMQNFKSILLLSPWPVCYTQTHTHVRTRAHTHTRILPSVFRQVLVCSF